MLWCLAMNSYVTPGIISIDSSSSSTLRRFVFDIVGMHFIALFQAAIDCRSYYFHYKRGFDSDDALECAAIPLFHRCARSVMISRNFPSECRALRKRPLLPCANKSPTPNNDAYRRRFAKRSTTGQAMMRRRKSCLLDDVCSSRKS